MWKTIAVCICVYTLFKIFSFATNGLSGTLIAINDDVISYDLSRKFFGSWKVLHSKKEYGIGTFLYITKQEGDMYVVGYGKRDDEDALIIFQGSASTLIELCLVTATPPKSRSSFNLPYMVDSILVSKDRQKILFIKRGRVDNTQRYYLYDKNKKKLLEVDDYYIEAKKLGVENDILIFQNLGYKLGIRDEAFIRVFGHLPKEFLDKSLYYLGMQDEETAVLIDSDSEYKGKRVFGDIWSYNFKNNKMTYRGKGKKFWKTFNKSPDGKFAIVKVGGGGSGLIPDRGWFSIIDLDTIWRYSVVEDVSDNNIWREEVIWMEKEVK